MAVGAFAVFVVLALAGSGSTQVIGFVGAIVIAVALVGGVPMAGWASHGHGLTSTARGGTVMQAEPEVLDEAPVDPTAWQRERERREAGDGVRAAPGDEEAQERYDPFGAGGRG